MDVILKPSVSDDVVVKLVTASTSKLCIRLQKKSELVRRCRKSTCRGRSQGCIPVAL